MVSSFDLFPIGVDGVTSKLNKLPYSDVYGSWIASSSQLTKRYWFHDGLDVSRETQGGVVVSFLLAVWDWMGLLMECFTWNVGVCLG